MKATLHYDLESARDRQDHSLALAVPLLAQTIVCLRETIREARTGGLPVPLSTLEAIVEPAYQRIKATEPGA